MKNKEYELFMKDYNDVIDMCFQLFYKVKELEFENERLNLKLTKIRDYILKECE